MMPRLTDLQAILLAHAAQRTSGSLLPAPETLIASAARIPLAVTSLIKRGLAEQRETNDAAAACRTDGDDIRTGAFITTAGLAAINVTDSNEQSADVVSAAPAPPRATKSASVVQMLQRTDGATLPELIDATGWLPHTTRAALTGLRKKGHTIERSIRGDATCYRIVSAA